MHTATLSITKNGTDTLITTSRAKHPKTAIKNAATPATLPDNDLVVLRVYNPDELLILAAVGTDIAEAIAAANSMGDLLEHRAR